jgi:hypothetical protein
MRGGHSELTQPTVAGGEAKPQSGLSKEYITQWSYGKMETFSLLIPNVKGGASGMLASQEAAVDAAQGYIEYSSQYSRGSTTRSANFTCRIPAAQYGLFLEQVQGTGSVVRTEESTEDATAQYVDLDARLKSLRTQETRLLQLMEESGSLEELLAVQDKLMEVQYQIESYTGQMKALSNRIDYATVHVYLEEVETYTPVEPTFGEEIGNAFRGMGENVKNTAEFLVLAVIYLIPLWVVGGIAGLVILFFVKRSKKKAVKQPAPPVYCPPAEPKE